MFGEVKYTNSGHRVYNFEDQAGAQCSLQEASIAGGPLVWVNLDGDRILLSQSQAERLSAYLAYFANTGELPDPPKKGPMNRLLDAIGRAYNSLPPSGK